jgi:hypothetical protein
VKWATSTTSRTNGPKLLQVITILLEVHKTDMASSHRRPRSRRRRSNSSFRVKLVLLILVLVGLSALTPRAAADTNFTWTGHYRPFWGVDVGIEGAFDATVHAVLQSSFSYGGAWYRNYSISSVTFKLPLRYEANPVPPDPEAPSLLPSILEDYLVVLDSSDFDLTYHSPPGPSQGGSYVIEAYTPAQGYSLYM